MPEMTLQEALQTPEVKGMLGGLIREAVDEAIADVVAGAVDEAVGTDEFKGRITEAASAAIDAKLPEIRETVKTDVARDGQVRTLHAEAQRLIEASPLKGAAKANLLEDYGLVEGDDDSVTPGRALALIEAEVDADGKVTKTAKAVLREAVDADVKRQRLVLRESAPSVPHAPGGGGPGESTPAAPVTTFGGKGSGWAETLRRRGMDPEQFGAAKPKQPATTTTT